MKEQYAIRMIANAIYINGRRSGSSWNAAACTPSALTLSVISDTQINGSFTINGTGQDGHKVYISTDGVNYTLKGTVTGSTATYSATGLIEDTKYYFYVVAYRGDIESDASNTANATTWISEYNDVYVTFAEKPSNNFSSVYNNFLKGWIAAGYWDRTDYLGISAIHSNTSNQAAKDWRNPSRTVTVVDTPPFTAKVGFDGPYPGTTHGYIKTGYNPGDGGSYNYTLNSGTFILYKSKDWTGGRVDVGSSDGTNQIYASINNAGNYLFRLNSSAYGSLPIASQIGTWIFTRNNNTQIVNYEPDGTKKTSSIASTAIPNHEIYQLAINNAGTENFYTGAVGHGMLIFMNGVNDTEAADIKNKIAGFFFELALIEIDGILTSDGMYYLTTSDDNYYIKQSNGN